MAFNVRDPTIVAWPQMLAPRKVTMKVDQPIWNGPTPLAGRAQSVVSSAGGWRLSLEDIPVFKLTKLPAYRAMWSQLCGSRVPVYVGPYDHANAPYTRAGVTTPILTQFSQPVSFSDGTKFSQRTGDCFLAADVAQNATQIQVTNSTAAPITAGDYIELNGRIHLVQGIWAGTPTLLSIWPPTRAAYSSGLSIEIDEPMMLAYLTPDSAALAQSLDVPWSGRVTFDFVEASW